MSNEVIIKGLSRLVCQFKDSEKFIAFLTVYLEQFQYLKEQNDLLETQRTLDDSQGVQLDGIGEIVGLARPQKAISAAGLFGFIDDDTAKGFGTLSDLDIGGNFISVNTISTQAVGDDLYRLLLRAKIVENTTTMTVDETTELLSFMLGGLRVRYFASVDLSPRYDIIGELDSFEQDLLNDLSLLIGMGEAEYHMYPDGATAFSFAEDSEGLGFGTLADSNIGGNFAQII